MFAGGYHVIDGILSCHVMGKEKRKVVELHRTLKDSHSIE